VHARDLPDQTEDPQEESLSPEQIAAAQLADEVRYERSLAAASNLIAERLTGRFVILDDIDEGTVFPDGTVDISGCALDEHGDLYAFWTAWDVSASRPTLDVWRRENVAGRRHDSVEYRRARALVGLPPTESEPARR
jgi:hypothetical protein